MKVKEFTALTPAFVILFLILFTFITACQKRVGSNYQLTQTDINKIKNLEQEYVQSWLNGDTLGVLNTLSHEIVLQPGGMMPIKGIENLKKILVAG